MGAPDHLLATIRDQGLRLWVEGDRLMVTPRQRMTDELRAEIRAHKAELLQSLAADALPDPAAEARRQCVLAILAERPGVRYALMTDTEADAEAVLLTLAIRDGATCEFRIPRGKYDPFSCYST